MNQEEEMNIDAGELEIREVKAMMEVLRKRGLVKTWELPYEEILSGLAQAVFFLTPVKDSLLEEIWNELSKFPYMEYRRNEAASVSGLDWRITFNRDFML